MNTSAGSTLRTYPNLLEYVEGLFEQWFPGSMTEERYRNHILLPWLHNRMVVLDIPDYSPIVFTWARLNEYRTQRLIDNQEVESSTWIPFQGADASDAGLLWWMDLVTDGYIPARVYVPHVVRWFLNSGAGKPGERLAWHRPTRGGRYGCLKLRIVGG